MILAVALPLSPVRCPWHIRLRLLVEVQRAVRHHARRLFRPVLLRLIRALLQPRFLVVVPVLIQLEDLRASHRIDHRYSLPVSRHGNLWRNRALHLVADRPYIRHRHRRWHLAAVTRQVFLVADRRHGRVCIRRHFRARTRRLDRVLNLPTCRRRRRQTSQVQCLRRNRVRNPPNARALQYPLQRRCQVLSLR
jgi:hypothetical protein